MSRIRREDGSTLVMVMGVIAVLVILAASLVMLTVNSLHATARDRTDKIAFDVAEAGIDLGQHKLYLAWPTASSPAVPLETDSFTTVDALFKDSTKYPISSARVTFMDDVEPEPGQPGPPYDDGNGLMYIRSTATVGGRTATVQAEVQQVHFPLRVRDKTALYTSGTLKVDGTGASNPMGLDQPATYADTFAAAFDPNPRDYEGFPTAQTPLDTDGLLTPNDVFPDATRLALIDEATAVDFVYASQPDWAVASAKRPHIIVVDSSVILAGGESLWTEADPGVLIVKGDITFRGTTSIYGIVYCDNAFGGTGTPDIHGMVVAIGSADLRGSRAVNYNSNVIANLNRMVVQAVRVVPNTWRQVGAN